MHQGKTLKLFLVDGVPNGLMTAEIMNWTGHVITASRSRLGELVLRPEVKQRTAVYFLLGPDQGAGIPREVYIGETDNAAQRLVSHNRPEGQGGKDFWEHACVITSKDANLTKAHIRYLESRLIQAASQSGQSVLINGTAPDVLGLPEADISDMEYFLEQIQTLLPVLGYDFLRPRRQRVQDQTGSKVNTETASPVFICEIPRHGIRSRGQEIDGDFVVFKGSLTRSDWEGVESSYTKLFDTLKTSGVLSTTPDAKHQVFTQDYAFSSVSAAAAVIAGRSANGRTQWVREDNHQTYGEWSQEQLSATSDTAV